MLAEWSARTRSGHGIVDDGVASLDVIPSAPSRSPRRTAELLTVGAPAAGHEARLGVGYNSLTGETRGVAVKDAAIYHSPIEGGQEVEFTIREIEHREHLRASLAVSASASYSGLFSVDAKAAWSNEATFDSRHLYLLISVKVVNTAISLREYELTDAARAMFAKEPYDWNGFYARYGDEFVHTVVSGGELYVLYEFLTRSQKEKDDLRASAKASFGGFKAKGDFEKHLDKVDTTTETTVTWFVRGGKGKLPDPLDPQKLISAALGFPEAVHPATGSPVVYRLDTRDYSIVEGFPTGDVPLYSRQVDENRAYFARLARMNDRLADAQRIVCGAAYSETLKETISRLTSEIANEARAVAHAPFVAHSCPPAFETGLAEVRQQLAWRPMPGELTQVAVGSHAHVWGLDKDDKIFRWNEIEQRWEEKPGRLCQIAVAGDGTVMGIHRNHDLFVWDPARNCWNAVSRRVLDRAASSPVTLTQLSVGHQNFAFGISLDGFPYHYRGDWIPAQYIDRGELKWKAGYAQVAVGGDETVWLRDNDHRIFRYREHRLEQLPGELTQIAVGDARHIWGLDPEQKPMRWTGDGWMRVPGTLAAISAGQDGTVWGITHAATLVRFHEEL